MMHLDAGAGALDYFPCRYGASKALFRGPARDLTQPYIAVLGGSASFGKYVAQPYPELLEQALGLPVANLAAQNAGPDLYLSDPAAVKIAAGAAVAVVQITGVEGLSNPFYSVHARRNDRFLAATPALRALYPEVDFTDIHFTRHLLTALRRADPQRFGTVLQVLQETWVDRMQGLLARLPGCHVLVWLSEAAPPGRVEAPGTGFGPWLVDQGMLAALQGPRTRLVEVVASRAALTEGAAGMLYPETEAQQARALPGAAVHLEAAERLAPEVARLMANEKGATLR
ncbi:MAG: DUF6473 family protein [Tabrizicola sp.]